MKYPMSDYDFKYYELLREFHRLQHKLASPGPDRDNPSYRFLRKLRSIDRRRLHKIAKKLSRLKA